MLEIILIISVIFLILTFFYKQAICEFRINQIEWSQKDNVSELLSEKVPIVVRNIPSATFWTHNDIQARLNIFTSIPIFKESNIYDWLSTSNSETICPWKYIQAEKIANVSGINIWSQKWMNSLIINPLLKCWMFPKYHCWAGNLGLRKTYATWTCLFPVDGDIIVSIMSENIESLLPSNWINSFPSQFTVKDTPFVSDIKFIDIILRPGNCMFIPSHWFFSCVSNSDKTPLICTISYHSPISYLAFNMSPYTK